MLHPLPLNLNFGTLAVDLGCFPFDDETYLTPSDSHTQVYGIRSLIRFGKLCGPLANSVLYLHTFL